MIHNKLCNKLFVFILGLCKFILDYFNSRTSLVGLVCIMHATRHLLHMWLETLLKFSHHDILVYEVSMKCTDMTKQAQQTETIYAPTIYIDNCSQNRCVYSKTNHKWMNVSNGFAYFIFFSFFSLHPYRFIVT